MSLAELGMAHKQVPERLVACISFNLKERGDIPKVIEELAEAIPAEQLAGPPYLVLQYISSHTAGYQAEIGFPVHRAFDSGRIRSKLSPALEVLSLAHQGPPEKLRESKLALQEFTRQHALISDEFTREVYPDWQNPQGAIELQFVMHPWNTLFARNLERALGAGAREVIMQGAETLDPESTPDARFRWTRNAVHQLDQMANETQKYDVLSSCAHVFPPGQLELLRRVYQGARAQSDDPLQAVDAVRAFMKEDPGWNDQQGYRQGSVLFHTKNPADPEAYAAAETVEEKRAAYCFCPILKGRLEQGMPVSYCYCGAGWYRQQWQAATGKPVRVEVVKSVLKGDEVCQFAVHLAEEL
jgi:effector-binding domain-containing protein